MKRRDEEHPKSIRTDPPQHLSGHRVYTPAPSRPFDPVEEPAHLANLKREKERSASRCVDGKSSSVRPYSTRSSLSTSSDFHGSPEMKEQTYESRSAYSVASEN